MNEKEPLLRVNFFDRLNASVLSLVTSEMPLLKRTRKRNNYPDFPTFDQPAPMPFKNVNIDGVHIRYAHSHAEGKPTLVMLCPFPQSIMAYAPFGPIWQVITAFMLMICLGLVEVMAD